MKRSAPLKQKKPLTCKSPLCSRKSSPQDIRIAPDKFAASVPVKRMRSKPKRPTLAEGSKYLEACRGESCFLRIGGVCCGNWETVVPAHSNESAHGKGMGIKAKHIFTVPSCMTCHAWLDTGPAWRSEKFMAWRTAYALWEPVRARKLGIEINQLEEIA